MSAVVVPIVLVLIASFLALLTLADLLPTQAERRAGLVAPLR